MTIAAGWTVIVNKIFHLFTLSMFKGPTMSLEISIISMTGSAALQGSWLHHSAALCSISGSLQSLQQHQHQTEPDIMHTRDWSTKLLAKG